MSDRRRLVVAENMSANGVIEFVEPWFEPDDQDDRELLDVVADHMSRETGLILGRTTFEEFRGFWPKQTDDETGFTEHLNRVEKYVVSRSLRDPGWEHSTVLDGRLEDEVRALKATGDGEIGITGSISVVHTLMATDLIDEFRLFVYPVFTAKGRRLFPDGLGMQGLTLTESRSFPSGIALLVYTRG